MVVLCFVRSVYSHLHASLILFTLQLDIFITSTNMSGVVIKDDDQPNNMPILFRGIQGTVTQSYRQRRFSDYTTFTNFSTEYLVMCKVYTDVGGVK